MAAKCSLCWADLSKYAHGNMEVKKLDGTVELIKICMNHSSHLYSKAKKEDGESKDD